MTSILKGLIVVFALFAFAAQWYALSKAENEKVVALIEKAEVNTEAKVLVAAFLRDHPQPTVQEIIRMKSSIDEILVKETSQRAIESAGIQQAKVNHEPVVESDSTSPAAAIERLEATASVAWREMGIISKFIHVSLLLVGAVLLLSIAARVLSQFKQVRDFG